MEIQIKSLTREDLINIFECYCIFDFTIPSKHLNLVRNHDDSLCEKLADVLLQGGSIEVADTPGYYADEIIDFYGKLGTNWISSFSSMDENEMHCPVYVITLQTIIDGINSDIAEVSNDVFDLLNGNADNNTAFRLLQAAIFGEVIYG